MNENLFFPHSKFKNTTHPMSTRLITNHAFLPSPPPTPSPPRPYFKEIPRNQVSNIMNNPEFDEKYKEIFYKTTEQTTTILNRTRLNIEAFSFLNLHPEYILPIYYHSTTSLFPGGMDDSIPKLDDMKERFLTWLKIQIHGKKGNFATLSPKIAIILFDWFLYLFKSYKNIKDI